MQHSICCIICPYTVPLQFCTSFGMCPFVVLDTLRQHDGPICDIVVSPSHFVTCSGDGTSHVWEHGDMTFPKYTMAVHNEAVETAAVLASDEMMIVTGCVLLPLSPIFHTVQTAH